MLLNNRSDYTQRLFNQFMANCDDQPFVYNCNDLIILSNDYKLLNRLQQLDSKNNHGTLSMLVEKELRITKLSLLHKSIRYAVLFSGEECWKSNFLNYNLNTSTCILFNNEQKLSRLNHLTSAIVNHHITNNNISLSQARVPYLQVKVSFDNNPITLPNNGLYLNGVDFTNLANRINNCIHTRCNTK